MEWIFPPRTFHAFRASAWPKHSLSPAALVDLLCGSHTAAGEEFVNSSTPVNAPTEVAGGPETEAHQIAERIENEEIEPARVADHNTSDNNRQSKARRQAPGEEGKTPPGVIKTGKCSPGQQTIRHREGERSAEVPLGP